MRLVWVQHWSYLPVIVEDIDPNNVPPGGIDPSLGRPAADPKISQRSSRRTEQALSDDTPSTFPPSSLNQQQSLPGGLGSNMAGQPPNTHGPSQDHPSASFDMSDMAEMLPGQSQLSQPHIPLQEHLRATSGANAAMGYPSMPHFPSQTPLANPGYGALPPQYASPYQQGTAHTTPYPQVQATSGVHSGGAGPVQGYAGASYYQSQQHPYTFYPAQYSQSQQGISAPYLPSYPRGSNAAFAAGPSPQHAGDFTGVTGQPFMGQNPQLPLRYGYGPGVPTLPPGTTQAAGSTSSLSSRPRSAIPSSPRGPPRKPKQSGHALWVGNLPSGTQVIHLKDHFSREATKTIESVFLISKSNCAFVNYRNDEACTAAMTRFHDSRFQGVRLVCRLRRGAAASSPGVPTGPASLTSSTAPSQTAIESIRRNREVSSRAEALANPEASTDDEVSPQKVDRYFIMKSLTAEDIELSIRNSIWATQAHNEEALNKAFNVGSFAAIGIFYADSRQTSKNVYLVFSANKSGEYFGYARMASPIDAEVAASLDWAPKADTVIDDPELPRSFPTPATEWAPKGRIIDDSARGTIFWEADHEDGDTAPTVGDEAEPPKETEAADEDDEAGSQSEAQAFGKPFKIEWIATNRLPFYRTRGLRNPWNANREVKIARDGTELEPGVGRRLLQMFEFHRTAPSPTTVQSTWPAGR
ncbi:MAG: hypothetical protein LQ351_005839 [Letrouitia transgressa]|nr:MAG: hypothetical protein LQ351_005839 [Letrouitia transgressa]